MGKEEHARWVRCDGLRLEPGEPLERLAVQIAGRLGVAPDRIEGWELLRRSLDARGNRPPRYEHTAAVRLSPETMLGSAVKATPWQPRRYKLQPPKRESATRPIVVGAGPAGLFATLRLAEYGFKPLIVERGKPVQTRVRDVASYWRRGELNPESNVQFGEGGAGSYSDGKLTSRSKDFRKNWVLEQLVAAGADKSILFDAHPHLGTDRLRSIVAGIRHRLEAQGASYRFETRVDSLLLRDELAAGVVTGEEELGGGPVFLATGHSARGLAKTLADQGVAVTAKGFALGFRVELPQREVDRRQYGQWADDPALPPAEFALNVKTRHGRGVYSFCMCPGGTVIPAASEPDGLVVNGMSGSKRSWRLANAALVAQTQPEDFGNDPWQGVALQRELEAQAQTLAGPRAVPAQWLSGFMNKGGKGRRETPLPSSSCPWPLVERELADCLPPFAVTALRDALPEMMRKLPALSQGVLIGVETRTSSPFRIDRSETMESVTLPGLYPIGEGGGYAGGIISSAIDGARAVDAWVATLGGSVEELNFNLGSG
jgi:uncharacterized FAD-dependent dehydrogenase